jgi:hypothetical protein
MPGQAAEASWRAASVLVSFDTAIILTYMARQESDREDLLRDAIALVERVELAPAEAGFAQRVVAGFRSDGAMSIYFGSDAAYQFNTAHELRRAFREDRLFKAVRGRLVSLERVRQQNEVQLLRRELSDAEQAAFLARLREMLSRVAADIDAGRFTVIGQVPGDADVVGRVRAWLAQHRDPPVAARPHVLAATREHCG